MKNLFLVFLAIYFLYNGIQSSTNAQNNQNLYSVELQLAFSNRSEDEKKISSNLFSKIFRYNKAISEGISTSETMKNFSPKFNKVDNKNRLSIMVRFKPGMSNETSNVKNIIISSGGVVSSEEIGHNGLLEIYCWMPIKNIIDIASNPGVAFIEKVYLPITNVTTAGDWQLKAADVRSSMNVTGEGNKIGVMSDGAKNWWDAAQAFELSSVNVLQTGDPEGNEGTAMLEIIYDLAPGAQLYFSGLSGTGGNLNVRAQRISELETYGCNIIVDDIWNPVEPFFTDETVLGTAIRNFINNGNVYITAAGNYRKRSLTGTSSFSNLYHIFPSGFDYYPITTSDNEIVILQWATNWSNPTEDLDLEIYNTSNQLVYFSYNIQSFTVPPFEIVDIPQGTYKIKIKRRSASDGVNFNVVTPYTDFVSGSMTNQIFGIAGYPNVISVAAYQADNQNTTSDYSSIGPAIMYSTASQQWTTQQVPTITATSGVETWVGVTNLWPDGNPVFDGTSASAPHIAGLAALYFHKLNGIDNLNKTNFDFINDLTQSATTIGNGTTGGTWNDKSGFGKANILATINRSLQTVATPVITPAGGTYFSQQTISITSTTAGATIYYTVDGTEPSQTNGTQYNTPFEINTDMTIIAKAFKTGYTESDTKTEVYTFSTEQAVATVTPGSGTYPLPQNVTIISWPSGNYECWKTETWDNSIPLDPQQAGSNAVRVWSYPNGWNIESPTLYKLKAQLKKDGQWGPVVYFQYDIKPSVRIAQIDDEVTGNDNSFGFWKMWENNHWVSYPDKSFIRPTSTTDYYLQAQQDYKINTFKKYNFWSKNSGENYFINHAQIPVGSTTSSVLAHFKNTYNATVTNKLENSFSINSGDFYFKDPWFIDDNTDSKGLRNRGTNPLPVLMNFKTTPNITTDSDHKGVFLNQNPTFDSNIPNYSVGAPLTQPINLGGSLGWHTFYFLNWEASPSGSATFQDPNSAQTAVVFNTSNATVKAVMKGTQLSNNVNAFSNNSQRKIIRTPDVTNTLHMVYESMGHVYYETSTDNGQSWTLRNGAQSLGFGGGKNPAIDWVLINSGAGTLYVIVVFQYPYPSPGHGYDIVVDIFGGILAYNPNSLQLLQEEVIYSNSYSSSFDANPVIAISSIPVSADVDIIWQTPSGLYFYKAYLYGDPNHNPVMIQVAGPTLIPNTNVNSINPSISVSKFDYNGSFSLAWEENNSIKHRTINGTSFGNIQTISAFDGYSYNNNPSIVVLNDNYSRICWKGKRYISQIDLITNTDNSYWQTRTVFRGINNNRFWSFGLNVGAPYINKSDDQNYYAIIWNQNENSTFFADNSLRTIRKINGIPGSSVQVSNGSTKDHMYAQVFNEQSLPYYFTTSNSIGSYYTAGKITNYAFSSGREGVIGQDSAQFYFTVGDIIVDDQYVDFIEIPDSIVFNSKEVLNEYLVSETFQLSDNSNFLYSIQYGITDSSAATGLLNNSNKYISFKLQLLDAQSSEVLGTFDEVTYDQSNMLQYNNLSYQVNTMGIGDKEVYLSLKVDDNFDPGYSLGEIYSTDNILAKTSFKVKNYTGAEVVESYNLSQNYPNPFNPATIINYQIPEDGFVTLKVYDILGKEVATLVNEEKSSGRYEVNFNASSLASGVYLYRLNVNDYVDVKKMLLLK